MDRINRIVLIFLVIFEQICTVFTWTLLESYLLSGVTNSSLINLSTNVFVKLEAWTLEYKVQFTGGDGYTPGHVDQLEYYKIGFLPGASYPASHPDQIHPHIVARAALLSLTHLIFQVICGYRSPPGLKALDSHEVT